MTRATAWRARRLWAAASVGAAALALAACSSNDGGSVAEPRSSTPTPSSTASATATAPSTAPAATTVAAPLAGTAVRPTTAAARAVAVVVTGGPGAAAPRWLDRSDLVYQELDNPGSQRYLAIFQTADSTQVGPVGATRPLDSQLLPVLHPVVGYGGGSSSYVRQLSNADLTAVSIHTSPGNFSGSGDNAYADTAKLRTEGSPLRPPKLLSFAPLGVPVAASGTRAIHTLTIRAAGHDSEAWTWDRATSTWSAVVGGTRVTAANVIVQLVPYKTVKLHFPNGPEAQSARVLGTGDLVAASKGVTLPGRWSKPGLLAATNYSDRAGVPLKLAPGRTWVVLAPLGTTTQVS